MKSARLVVLAIALVAGLAAAVLALNMTAAPPPPPAPVAEAAPPPKIDTEEVLVASKDIAMGGAIQEGDLIWTEWPKANMVEFLVTKSQRPEAAKEFVGAVARAPFLTGEPIREQRLMRTDRGFMSVILPAGMRAVAVEVKAASTAGGFILPNDRVDVILTRASPKSVAGADPYVSETLMQNIRVLAIDQQISEKSTEGHVVARETATLELSARQVEMLAQAQQLGTVSLALRSIADQAGPANPDDGAIGGSVRIVRYGIVTKVTTRK